MKGSRNLLTGILLSLGSTLGYAQGWMGSSQPISLERLGQSTPLEDMVRRPKRVQNFSALHGVEEHVTPHDPEGLVISAWNMLNVGLCSAPGPRLVCPVDKTLNPDFMSALEQYLLTSDIFFGMEISSDASAERLEALAQRNGYHTYTTAPSGWNPIKNKRGYDERYFVAVHPSVIPLDFIDHSQSEERIDAPRPPGELVIPYKGKPLSLMVLHTSPRSRHKDMSETLSLMGDYEQEMVIGDLNFTHPQKTPYAKTYDVAVRSDEFDTMVPRNGRRRRKNRAYDTAFYRGLPEPNVAVYQVGNWSDHKLIQLTFPQGNTLYLPQADATAE